MFLKGRGVAVRALVRVCLLATDADKRAHVDVSLGLSVGLSLILGLNLGLSSSIFKESYKF